MSMPSEPTPTPAPPASYWQVPSSNSGDYQLVPQIRARLVALVAALVTQATIALLGLLPDLPTAPALKQQTDGYTDYYTDYSQPVGFWVQFAVVEFIAAVLVSFAFGPGIRFGKVPAIAQLVLVLGFVVLPAVALVLGGIEAAQTAAKVSPAVAASSWLTTIGFGILFFGLPWIALVAPAARSTVEHTGQRPA